MFNTERIENLEKRISRIEQIQNAPWDACIQMDCTAGNFYFRPFEEHHKETEYIIGDLLKIPKEREPGKFILAKVEDEGYTKEICYDCAFKQNHLERMECCVANKCVDYFRDTNKYDIYYKPLAEVSEMKQKKVRDFEVFKVVHPITANEVAIQAIPRDTISCNGCAFRKGDLESMCKAYLCFSERTLDCLVFKVVKEKFKRNITEF